MTTRRTVLIGGSAGLLGSTSAFAGTLGKTASPSGDVDALEQFMARTLTGQLDDADVAQKLAAHISEAGFRWSYPQMPVRDVDSIVAYSFGYRSATGTVNPETGLSDTEEAIEPGPINAMLADAVNAIQVSAIHRARPVRIYAQWEIAQCLRENHKLADVVPIYPTKDGSGKTVYLSTDGVAKAVVAHAGSAAALGRVAVVGHRDHVKRCILVSQSNGMNAAAAREVPLPAHYDPQSAQPWTRRRDLYLLSDMIAQLTMTRSRMMSEAIAG